MRRKYSSGTGFLDMLFNTLMCFVVLFAISFMQITKRQNAEAEIKKPKAEFLITITWENNYDNDVDTWLEDPLGNVMWFRYRNIGLMHLDRDDRGILDDRVMSVDGEEIRYQYNQEITSIRGFVPGEWVLNIHMYAMREQKPSHVTVRMDKLNPSVETVFQKDIHLTQAWQQVTVARFFMSAGGSILSMNTMSKDLIKDTLHYMQPSEDPM